MGLRWMLWLWPLSGCLAGITPPLEMGTAVGSIYVSADEPELATRDSDTTSNESSREPEALSADDGTAVAWDIWGVVNFGQLYIPKEAPRDWDIGVGYHSRGVSGEYLHGPLLQLEYAPWKMRIGKRANLRFGARSRTQAILGPQSGVRQGVMLSADLVYIHPRWSGGSGLDENEGAMVAFASPGQVGVGLYLEADYSHFPQDYGMPDYWSVTAGVNIRLPTVGFVGIFWGVIGDALAAGSR